MEPVEDETRVQQLQAKLTELQKTQPDLYKALTSEGILLNTIENTEQLVRLSRYIDYLNFLYTVTRVSDDDPAETSREIGAQGKIDLVRRYKELRSEETDDILHKELIEYKYLEAILRDVVRMGYVIRRKKQGT
ncbi:MAG: hypothetical protein H6767_06605 [Candidatus Peribacteria bacterium]|nr:MAG: hypothetical protein H6767_06605 [Candidatus Peribacteria bacterium]